MYNKYLNSKIVDVPLFTEDKKDNNRLLRLINGEFICMPYKDSTAYKYVPEGEQLISTVCGIGIPPSYGEFSGILTIYLKDVPNSDLTEQLFLLSREISLRIYDDNGTEDNIKNQH